ncbi:MAG TPA: hypothetical protein VGW33_00165 [Terriglobia bacterium]|nr:hypothetical protein [Terriglobia bacterium]
MLNCEAMADWGDWWHSPVFQVILTGVAYIGGVLTKPLQDWVATKQEERNVRQSLYAELARNLNVAERVRQQTKGEVGLYEGLAGVLPLLSFECFDSAKRNATSFNRLREAGSLQQIYSLLLLLTRVEEKVQTEVINGVCTTALTVAAGFTLRKQLKPRLILRLLNLKTRKHLLETQDAIRQGKVTFDPL